MKVVRECVDIEPGCVRKETMQDDKGCIVLVLQTTPYKSKKKDAVEARQGHSSCRWDWRRLHRRALSALSLFHCTLTGLGVTVRCSEWEGRPVAGGRVTDGSSGWPIRDGLEGLT